MSTLLILWHSLTDAAQFLKNQVDSQSDSQSLSPSGEKDFINTGLFPQQGLQKLKYWKLM